MRAFLKVIFFFLGLPVVLQCSSEGFGAASSETSTPLEEIIIPKAREWAELCLQGLSVQDRVTVCAMLNISYQFAHTDLQLKKTVRALFDECCFIQDKAQRFVGITEDTERLKQLANEVDKHVKAYNDNLGKWNVYVDQINKDNKQGILNALLAADNFTSVYINAFIQQGKASLCYEFTHTIATNLQQTELVRNTSISLLDSIKNLKDSAKEFDDIMTSSFELARVHFCNEIKSILIMRELFDVQEELLALRKVIAYVFYQTALPYCDSSEHQELST